MLHGQKNIKLRIEGILWNCENR